MISERRTLGWFLSLCALGVLSEASFVSAAPLRVFGAPGPNTPEDPRVAKQFSEAVRLYKQGKVDQALPIFQAVADRSASPNAHLYVGHCLVQQRKYVEAHHAFAIAIKEIGKRNDDKYEATREAAQAQLSWLSARVAKVVVSPTEIPPNLVAKVDGRPIDPSDLGSELVLAPGTHRVEASADGVVPVVRDVEIGSGESKTIALAFQKIETKPSPSTLPAPTSQDDAGDPRATYRTLGFVAGGVGIVGLAVFTVAGLGAKSTHDALERDCPEGACADPDDERIDRGRSQQKLANAGLAAGLIGVAASGTLLYFGFSGSPRSETSVALGPERATLAYRLRF